MSLSGSMVIVIDNIVNCYYKTMQQHYYDGTRSHDSTLTPLCTVTTVHCLCDARPWYEGPRPVLCVLINQWPLVLCPCHS